MGRPVEVNGRLPNPTRQAYRPVLTGAAIPRFHQPGGDTVHPLPTQSASRNRVAGLRQRATVVDE